MKKSLSILLALLMILSSLPIMTFAASAEQADSNLLAGYTAEDFGNWRWNSISDNTSIAKGDDTSDILVTFPGSQNIFTTVTLEPNTEYSLDFSWYSKNVDGGMSSPTLVDVYPVEDGVNVYDTTVYKEFDGGNDANKPDYNAATEEDMAEFKKCVWYEGIMPAGEPREGERYNGYLPAIYGGAYGTDLIASEYHEQRMNDVWRSSSAKFTTTEYTNYIIIIGFDSQDGDITKQELYLADFSLMDPDYIPLEDKRPGNWDTFRWTQVNKTADPITVDGITSELRVDSCISHRVFTTIPAKNVKENEITFKYYSGSGITVSGICVYPDTVGGDIHSKMDTTGNGWFEGYYDAESNTYIGDQWLPEGKTGTNYYAQFVPGRLSANPNGIQIQRTCGADASTTWQTATVKFPSVGAETYHLIIEFGGNDATGNTCYFADFEHTGAGLSKEGNLLDGATYANGDVSWTTTTDVDNRVGNVDAWGGSWNDNYTVSYDGGYSWAFGFGDGKVGGNNIYTDQMYLDTYGYVYIKANDLKADATYDFSFITRFLFKFMPHSIAFADGTNAVENYISGPATEIMADDQYSEKTSLMFKVPVDGDYVITLKANRANYVTNQSWNMNGLSQYGATVLCDLELYEKGAMYNVVVSKEGNGYAKADNTGLTEKGTTVTFTARPEIYEKFIGWYVGDELVSEDLTYVATVEGALAPVAKFTSNSENLMSDYTVANFGAMPNGAVADFAHSNYGGNGIHATKVPHQNVFTTVTLEAGKEYTFGFNWKSQENIYNKAYPNTIQVFQKAAGDPFDASSWNDNKWPPYQGDLTTYPDIENGGGYTNQDIANTCTWQSLITSFTPTVTAEYVIMINLTFAMQDLGDGNLKHYNNDQGVYFSEFVLKEKYVDLSDPIGSKVASDWKAWNYSEVSDSGESRFGGNAYYVNKAMYQSIATDINLKPGTEYRFSFEWKAVANDKGNAYPAGVYVYSAKSGTIPPAGAEDKNAASPYPANGFDNLTKNVTYPVLGEAVLTEWNTLSGTFTTTEDASYYLTIYFTRDGTQNADQKIYLSDFVIEEVVKGTAPAADDMIDHPGVSIRKASESTFGQALRYKFTIAGSVIANAQEDGYELVEYGTVVALIDELAGHAADPIMNATSYTVRKGVAYNKDDGTNIQFAVDTNGDVTYTAALYNIPTSNYSSSIAVRPYAIFRNADGDSYVRYGTTRVASVFEVAKAILEGSNSDDIAYVNDVLLAGDIKAAYDAWVAEQ